MKASLPDNDCAPIGEIDRVLVYGLSLSRLGLRIQSLNRDKKFWYSVFSGAMTIILVMVWTQIILSVYAPQSLVQFALRWYKLIFVPFFAASMVAMFALRKM